MQPQRDNVRRKNERDIPELDAPPLRRSAAPTSLSASRTLAAAHGTFESGNRSVPADHSVRQGLGGAGDPS